MTVCDSCGGLLDPDVTHIHHPWDCEGADECGCPEVCADCCTDPDCALRQPQEITMPDPAPLPDDEIEWFKEVLAFDGPNVSVGVARRLVATVEQARRERDTAVRDADTLRQARIVIERGLVAFRLTREYVGEDVLPEVVGWSWFDWCQSAERFLTGEALVPPAPDSGDIDTLGQARQLAITYRRTAYGIDRQQIAGQLVDLLAPPAPDSGEGTG